MNAGRSEPYPAGGSLVAAVVGVVTGLVSFLGFILAMRNAPDHVRPADAPALGATSPGA